MSETDTSETKVWTDREIHSDISLFLNGLFLRTLQSEEEKIDPGISIQELGADSLILFEIIEPIERRFGIRLKVRQFFDELLTINDLADYIALKAVRVEGPQAPTKPVDGRDEHEVIASVAVSPARFAVAERSPGLDSVPANGSAVLSESDLIGILRSQLDIINRQLALLGRPSASTATLSMSGPPSQRAGEADARTRGADEKSSPSPNGALKAAPPLLSKTAAPSPKTTRERQEFLSTFIPRYTSRTKASKEHARRLKSSISDSRSSIGFRPAIKELVYPLVCTRSEGASVVDLDGHSYVDMTMGYGVHLFGHAPDFLRATVKRYGENGVGLGFRNDISCEVADRLRDLTGMDRFAFVNDGTEAVMTAVRLARAATGRDEIVIFSTSYHGQWDGVLATGSPGRPIAAGIPSGAVSSVNVLAFDSEESVDYVRANGKTIAAVMIEPVPTRSPGAASPSFLQKLRKATRETGSILILDEIVTGFRCHPGGIQQLLGLEADIVTYGKIIGGGFPLGVIAGRGQLLDAIDGGTWNYGDASAPVTESVFFGGTFFQHPLSMAAARAVLEQLKCAGAGLQISLTERTSRFVSDLNDWFAARGAPIRAESFSSFFRLIHGSNVDLLYYMLIEKGVYIWEWRCWFLSTAHSDGDLANVKEAIFSSVDELMCKGLI